MKHHVGLTIEVKLYREIEMIRGREKRSTFIEHLIRLGLKSYILDEKKNNQHPSDSPCFLPPAPREA